jgi:hypothetical protein
VWAAGLVLVGMAVAARAFVALMFATHLPVYYEPALIVVGLAGIAATAAAFMTVHDRRLPWILLAAATSALGWVMVLTALVT